MSIRIFCTNYIISRETASILGEVVEARRLRVEQFELSLVRALYSAVQKQHLEARVTRPIDTTRLNMKGFLVNGLLANTYQ